MSILILDKPGRVFGIVPKGGDPTHRPAKYRRPIAIGLCRSVSLTETAAGSSVHHDYDDDRDAAHTGVRFDWLLANATSTIRVELANAVKGTTDGRYLGNGYVLLVGFSKKADERAYRAAFPRSRKKMTASAEAKVCEAGQLAGQTEPRHHG